MTTLTITAGDAFLRKKSNPISKTRQGYTKWNTVAMPEAIYTYEENSKTGVSTQPNSAGMPSGRI